MQAVLPEKPLDQALRQPLKEKIKGLVADLIEKMGRDEHMEERFRIQDQEQLDPAAFNRFLQDRGVETPEQYTKGEDEIVLNTGPHLGGFNQAISVPGLIEFLFCVSGLIVSERYLNTLSI